MDKLALSTQSNPDGTFSTRWQWWQNIDRIRSDGEEPRKPIAGGVITVTLAQRWTEDRPILAEICAIHQLLCVEEVHGKNRLGVNLEIGVSFAAIRKALKKETLKTTDRGDTNKYIVALFCKFVAVKFFEAKVVADGTSKWVDFAFESPRNFAIEVHRVPSVDIASPLGSVSITHHALNRVVERRMTEGLVDYVVGDMTTIPDVRWTRAWKWLQRVLPKTEVVNIPDYVMDRIVRKHGVEIVALRCVGSQSIFILKPAGHGLDLVTVLDDTFSNKITAAHKLPKLCGQDIVYPGRRPSPINHEYLVQ